MIKVRPHAAKLMKITIEIPDALFAQIKSLARKDKTSFRALTEAGLRLVISGKHLNHPRKLPRLVTFGGGGSIEEFSDWKWDRIRDEIYPKCQA